MKRVALSLPHSEYEVLIEKGSFRKMASDIKRLRSAEQYVVITDSKVNRLYASDLETYLKREDLFLGKIVVPSGEKSKSMAEFESCLEKMVKLGANRSTGVIALGGGVVGDLGGYVAASYMRGVPLIHIPTTLLAMVDSSIGGKVGIDLESGKNLVGAFWQPEAVFVDPEFLQTLPKKHWKAGLGEAVKYGAISDRSLWDFFEEHLGIWNKEPEDFLPSDWRIVEEMIQRCVQIKADVVMKDEKEGNVRQVLNYGHTFAHVIELMSDYKIIHGEAVATGMRVAADVAVKMRVMTDQESQKQKVLLDQLGIGKAKTKGLISEFVKHMYKDKKAKGDLRLVLVSRLGRTHQHLGKFGIVVDEKLVKEVLKDSGLIDDKKPAPKVEKATPVTSTPVSSTPSYSSPSYSSTSYSSGASSSSSQPETDLQRRLREMRERRAARDQSGGGLSSGGFLPG